jgi:glycosyltransferase involved in cell wall biosynthesis
MLPGAHSVNRGAEVAFESVATELAQLGEQVTLFGSGPDRSDRPYRYRRSGLIRRERFERFPNPPPFRTNYIYEELTWTAGVLRHYRPSDFDVTVTCSFPFVNWLATRWPPRRRSRPAHVFVTQNGDHPARRLGREYRSFRCDGVVCTNPLYYERQQPMWPCALLPNGIDPDRFRPGPHQRERFGIPADVPVVLMVSALVDTKRVLDVMEPVARIPDAHLVVAGDGPLRDRFDRAAEELMPGRARRLVVPSDQMPDLYRSADVVLHPALFESFGNAYVEAMATGIPLVAHDFAGTRWIVGDDQGLVDTTDPNQVEAALRAALRPDRSALLRRAAEAHDRFAWRTIAAGYRDFFARVIAEGDR